MRTFAIITTLLLATTSLVHAQGRPGAGMPMDDAAFRPTVPMLTSMLTLSQAQVRQVTVLRDSLLAATKAARAEAAAAQAAMQQARQAGVPRDSLAKLRTSMQQIMMGMMPARMTFHNQLRALLTDEQAKVLDAHQREMMGTMGERMRKTEDKP